VLAQPGSISAHTRFEANVYLMTREESGLEANLCSGSQLPFYFRTRDFPGIVTLPPGVETIRPGEQGSVTGTLEPPALVPMEKNLRFAIRQGGRAVGFGMVTRILE
jgi:elongation factor Tu